MPVRVLLLCTANQCRSPMAAGLLRHRLGGLGVDAVVESAGLLDGGRPATDDAVAVLAARGVDIAGHVSRSLAEGTVDLAAADLVIGMERRHVLEAVVADPSVQQRAFTLIDLVRRAEAAEARRPDETVRGYAARLAVGRTPADLLGVGDDAVADPIGRPRAAYQRTADQLDDLLGRFVARCFATADEVVA